MSHNTSTTPARQWMTPQQAADHLGITDRTLRRYIARGQLPAYRMGNRVIRVRLGDVEALLRPIPTTGA